MKLRGCPGRCQRSELRLDEPSSQERRPRLCPKGDGWVLQQLGGQDPALLDNGWVEVHGLFKWPMDG